MTWRAPTLLGLANRVLRRFAGRVVSHTVTTTDWRPWWHGDHVPGSWRVGDATPWFV